MDSLIVAKERDQVIALTLQLEGEETAAGRRDLAQQLRERLYPDLVDAELCHFCGAAPAHYPGDANHDGAVGEVLLGSPCCLNCAHRIRREQAGAGEAVAA